MVGASTSSRSGGPGCRSPAHRAASTTTVTARRGTTASGSTGQPTAGTWSASASNGWTSVGRWKSSSVVGSVLRSLNSARTSTDARPDRPGSVTATGGARVPIEYEAKILDVDPG